MSFIRRCVQSPIRLYRYLISPLFASSCRFTPTCSAYALEAIEKHGVFKGLILSFWRILRCNPWYKCTHDDPVPERFAWRTLIGYKREMLKKDTCNL